MNRINIYLSGNMTPNVRYYNQWTSEFIKALKESERYRCSVSCLKHHNKLIVHHNLARLHKCDIVVVNLGLTDVNHHLTGAVIEMYEAIKQQKVVYAFTGEGMIRSVQADSPWVSEFITHEFNSMQDVIDHLVHDDNIPL